MDSNTTFKEATTIVQQGSHEYIAYFQHDWCIGTVPNGGYVASCFLKVASAHYKGTLSAQNQPHTITLHLDFLRRTQVGPAIFKVQDTKLGRQTSVIHITLSQPRSSEVKPPYAPSELREEVVGYITNSNLGTEVGLSLPTDFALSPPPAPIIISKLALDQDEYWAKQGAVSFADFRRATQKMDFYFPRREMLSRSISDEWVCFRNGERFTNESLGFVADMFPLPVDQYQATNHKDGIVRSISKYWFPTLLLNLDVKKALPKEGVKWLFARCRPKQIKNGRMDLEVIIMDEEGEIVALSHHVCLIVEAERNVATRRDGISKL